MSDLTKLSLGVVVSSGGNTYNRGQNPQLSRSSHENALFLVMALGRKSDFEGALSKAGDFSDE